MTEVIDFLREYDYALFVAAGFALVWLVWIPRVVSPLIAERYAKLPAKWRALLLVFLPTIERALLNGWDGLYNDVLMPLAEETEETDLDNKILVEIDKRLVELLSSLPGEPK